MGSFRRLAERGRGAWGLGLALGEASLAGVRDPPVAVDCLGSAQDDVGAAVGEDGAGAGRESVERARLMRDLGAFVTATTVWRESFLRLILMNPRMDLANLTLLADALN